MHDYNNIQKMEGKIKVATINLNIVEVNNSLFINSYQNFYVTFMLVQYFNSYEENKFTTRTSKYRF